MPRNTKNSSQVLLGTSLSSSSTDAEMTDASANREITLSILAKKLDHIVERLDKLEAVEKRLGDVEVSFERSLQQNAEMKRKINKLEERLENIENTARRANVIISGTEVTKISTDNINQSVVDFLKRNLHYELPQSSMLSATRLGAKPQSQAPDARKILVKLRDYELKRDIITTCRRLKPVNVFVNGDLTPQRAKILYTLRQVKRKSKGKISACGSQDGKIFAFVKPPNPAAKDQKMIVDSIEKLDEFCVREWGVVASMFVGNSDVA